MANPVAQRHFLVKVAGIGGHFMTKSGGSISSGTTKVYDGGALTPDVISSAPEAENVTVGRAFDYDRDSLLIKELRKKVGSWRTTVSVTPTTPDMVARGRATVYSDALLVGLGEPDYDSSGGDAANWTLEFAIGAFI